MFARFAGPLAATAFLLPATAWSESLSDADCAKVVAALTDMAVSNQANAEVFLELWKLQLEFALLNAGREGAGADLQQKYFSALEGVRDIDGKMVGEGILVLRRVCPNSFKH